MQPATSRVSKPDTKVYTDINPQFISNHGGNCSLRLRYSEGLLVINRMQLLLKDLINTVHGTKPLTVRSRANTDGRKR